MGLWVCKEVAVTDAHCVTEHLWAGADRHSRPTRWGNELAKDEVFGGLSEYYKTYWEVQATEIMEVLKQESDFPAFRLIGFVESKLKFGETCGRDIIVWMWCFCNRFQYFTRVWCIIIKWESDLYLLKCTVKLIFHLLIWCFCAWLILYNY